MKKITITVNVDGNELSREYQINEKGFPIESDVWGSYVADMLDTIEKSNDPKF